MTLWLNACYLFPFLVTDQLIVLAKGVSLIELSFPFHDPNEVAVGRRQTATKQSHSQRGPPISNKQNMSRKPRQSRGGSGFECNLTCVQVLTCCDQLVAHGST